MTDSLNQALIAAQRQAILNHMTADLGRRLGELLDEAHEAGLGAAARDLTVDDLVNACSQANASVRKSTRSVVRTADVCAAVAKWRATQEVGYSATIGDLCHATGYTAAQLRRALKRVSGIRKRGVAAGMVYEVVHVAGAEGEGSDGRQSA